MTNQRSRFRSVVYLTVAGLLSSLLTVWVSGSGKDFLGLFGVGVIFGVVLANCFCLSFGVRSPWKLGGFVATSAAAYPLALSSFGPPPFGYLSLPFAYPALYTYKLFGFAPLPPGQIDPIVLWGPGAVGVFLILVAGLFTISSQKQPGWHILLKGLLGALVGGLVGAVGYALGPSLGLVLWHAFRAPGGPMSSNASQSALAMGDPNFYSMYVAWQTGVALLLGLLWWHGEAHVAVSAPAESPEAAPVPAASERISLTAKLFFIGAAVLLFYFVGRSILSSYDTARIHREIAQSIAEAPSTQNLPPLQPLPLSQALILGRIADFAVLNTYDSNAAAGRAALVTSGVVPRAYYSADYVKVKEGVTEPALPMSTSRSPNIPIPPGQATS